MPKTRSSKTWSAWAVVAIGYVFSPGTLPAFTIDGSTVTLMASDQTADNTSLIQGLLNNAPYSKIIIQPGTSGASWVGAAAFFQT